MGPNTEEEADAIVMTIPPLVEMLHDEAGVQILSEEGLPVSISVDETIIEITPEVIEVSAPDINLTAEIAMEMEAAADFDLTVGGACAVETADFSLAAGAAEFDTGLFTVL